MIPLVALLCFSLAAMGCLFWVDNGWAFIRQGSSGGETALFDLPLAGGLDPDEIQKLDADGDQDDNKPEPLKRIHLAGAFITPEPGGAGPIFQGRWGAKSYLDFGHLKIFSDAPASLINENEIVAVNGCRAVFAWRPFILWG